MSGEESTKTVVHLFMAWNDRKEERWLAEQARSGWHVMSVGPFGYTLERGAPEEVAYRLDWGPSCRQDSSEYLGLFKDAGWEHVGRRGKWNVFRKPVANGVAPEIYTDPQSRIAMYRRVIGFLVIFLGVMVSQMGPQIGRFESSGSLGRFPLILAIYGVLTAFFLYGILRLLLVIWRLKKGQPSMG